MAFELIGDGFQLVFAPGNQNEGVSISGKQSREFVADPAGGAGNQHRLSQSTVLRGPPRPLPCSRSVASRSVSTLVAIPRFARMSSKRDSPRNRSRRTNRVHLTPITSKLRASERASHVSKARPTHSQPPGLLA